MPDFQIREEVLNVLLAELLSARGLVSVPESIRKSITGKKRLPDVGGCPRGHPGTVDRPEETHSGGFPCARPVRADRKTPQAIH